MNEVWSFGFGERARIGWIRKMNSCRSHFMKREDTLFLEDSRDYQRMEKVLLYLAAHREYQPSLEELAQVVALSPFHFQRLFKRWVGLSPKQFMDLLTIQNAKSLLKESKSLLDVSLDLGLSGPSRLHDLFLKLEAMTPGEFKLQGKNLEIVYGFHPTRFGMCFVALTERGICALSFVEENAREVQIEALKDSWPHAKLKHDQSKTRKYLQKILLSKKDLQKNAVSLLLKGTPFQIKVWQALIQIPKGALVSYEDIANFLHKPKAVRAVASAIVHNPIAYLIPCHRVIQKVGNFGEYRWGASRKKAILGWEINQKGENVS